MKLHKTHYLNSLVLVAFDQMMEMMKTVKEAPAALGKAAE